VQNLSARYNNWYKLRNLSARYNNRYKLQNLSAMYNNRYKLQNLSARYNNLCKLQNFIYSCSESERSVGHVPMNAVNEYNSKLINQLNLLISTFRLVLSAVCFRLGDSPSPKVYIPKFRNILSVPSSWACWYEEFFIPPHV
jgi:hypothetical protein